MKAYKKGDETSYTLGVFPTIELLKTRPQDVVRVVVHSSIEQNKGYPFILELCQKHHIHIDVHDKTIDKLSPKSNCYAIGVFKTYSCDLQEGNHVVLVNPMDMGNMGVPRIRDFRIFAFKVPYIRQRRHRDIKSSVCLIIILLRAGKQSVQII